MPIDILDPTAILFSFLFSNCALLKLRLPDHAHALETCAGAIGFTGAAFGLLLSISFNLALISQILVNEGAQSTLFYRGAQTGHQALIVAQVVDGIQA